jgi:hypothetical protein
MDPYVMDCWIAGCGWTENLTWELTRQMQSVEFDDLRVAHLWTAHPADEILSDIERRIRELTEDRTLTQEQREDRVAIIRIMRVAFNAMLDYPLPDDPT